MLDDKKIITCSKLNEMWRKCFHDAMLDNHPALDNRWLAQAKEVFYYQNVGSTIGYDPMGGDLCATFAGNEDVSDYDFDDELNYIWSHYLETSEPKSILNPNRNKKLMNPLANDTQSTDQLVSEEKLEFYPYDYYTILNNINIYDNLTVVDGSTHVFNSNDIWVSWQIAGITAFESSPYTSSNTFCCTCNIGIDEDISGRPVYLTVTFKNTKNVEYIKSVHVNTCFSKNEKFSDRDFNPTSISANGSSQGTVDATVQATFVGKFKSLREILTSQLHFNFYATWEPIGIKTIHENIAINQNWHIKISGERNIYPNFGQVNGLVISSVLNNYRKLYLFDNLDASGVEIDDFVVPSLATQKSQGINSELKVNTKQLENAIQDLGYSVLSSGNYYLKVPYYVMSNSEDGGGYYTDWCYVIIGVEYDPDSAQGNRWRTCDSEAYIDVGTTDVSSGGGLYIRNDMGDLEYNWTFGNTSFYGYGNMVTNEGLLIHPANLNLPHKTYIEVEANSNVDSREITCQFVGGNNTTKTYRFWYDTDSGGSMDEEFNFISTSNLLDAVRSFNSNNTTQNYFIISW
jgi:hypothetical protein